MEINGLLSVQVFVAFALTVLKSGCHGFCYIGPLMAEMTVSRRLRYYCEYKGVDGNVIKLFPGSNLYLVDQCLDCKCTMDGLQCCGFGYAGGSIAIRKDCKMLLDGCQALIVRKDNGSIDCFSGKPINFTSLSEQLPHPDNTYKSLNVEKRTPLASTPIPEVMTTTAAPTLPQTTSRNPARTGQDGVMSPTMADYFRYMLPSRSSTSNQPNGAHILPRWHTGRSLSYPSTFGSQQPPLTNNFWQFDNLWPWYLFI